MVELQELLEILAGGVGAAGAVTPSPAPVPGLVPALLLRRMSRLGRAGQRQPVVSTGMWAALRLLAATRRQPGEGTALLQFST